MPFQPPPLEEFVGWWRAKQKGGQERPSYFAWSQNVTSHLILYVPVTVAICCSVFVFTLLYVICLWLLTHATPVTSHLLVLHKRSVSTLFPLHYICRSRCEEDTLWTLTKPGITLCTCTLHTDHGYAHVCMCALFSFCSLWLFIGKGEHGP